MASQFCIQLHCEYIFIVLMTEVFSKLISLLKIGSDDFPQFFVSESVKLWFGNIRPGLWHLERIKWQVVINSISR